jgi:intein/homing endonuclease
MDSPDCLLKSRSLSKAKKVQELFKSNPDLVADVRFCRELLEKYEEKKVSLKTVSCIVQRLWKRGLLVRTPTQLRTGYLYTFKNRELIEQKYDDFLIPYALGNRVKLLNEILKSDFEKLRCDYELDLNRIHHLSFVRKYGPDYFQRNEVQEFLASNIGFLICDGHIKKTKKLVQYYFRYEKDALLFKENFHCIFPHERLYSDFFQFCFRVSLFSVGFANLMHSFGIPLGNKVFQPFVVLDWIYHGRDKLKRAFLSAVFGGEGSAPSNNKWRIQFVISKCEKEVSNLLFFINQIRAMLSHFDISSSHIQLRKQGGTRQFCARFYIKGKNNLLKFYKLIGFAYASEKQEVLEDLLRRHSYIN